MSNTTINYDNYLFNLCLDDKEIIIKITNNDTLDNYECNLYDCDLQLKSIKKFNNLMIKTLNKEANYIINILEKNDKIECKIIFTNDIFDVEENLILKKNKSTNNDTLKLKQIITVQQNEINEMKQRLTKMELLEKRLEQLENEQYIMMKQNTFDDVVGEWRKINKNIDMWNLSAGRGCGKNPNDLCIMSQFDNIDYVNSPERHWRENIGNYLVTRSGAHSQIIKDKYLFFNINKIIVTLGTDAGLPLIELCLDIYLKFKKDFKVKEIQINDNCLIETLIKYTNYNKLVIKYNKEFNDSKIKEHCRINNIKFDYMQ